jgi:hypothetical protein
MRYLSKNELYGVSGGTIVNDLPSGTEIYGYVRNVLNTSTGISSSVLLYAYQSDYYSYDSDHDYTEITPYYFNENYLPSMTYKFGCNWVGTV